ncbi:MAG: magnesium transporter [Clostridia bacterium]|nr:magnesium transporter [Clostridia bacterium]
MENNILDLELAQGLYEEKKIGELGRLLKTAEPADIALLFDMIDEEQHRLIFRLLPKELAAEVFVEMPPDTQEALINAFTDKELQSVLDELYLDDTVDIVEEMPANVVTRIIKNSHPDSRKAINQLLSYSGDTAGSIMTIEFVSLRPSMTVEEAFIHLRKTGTESETIYTCYVTENKKLLGFVSVYTLILSDKDSKISDIMNPNVIAVNTSEDRGEAANLLMKYDFLALPVVDNENRLVGIITIDDAVDVISEEDEEDIAKMSAITPTDRPYIKTSPFKIFLTRVPWLMILMLSATFTGIIISSFEKALAVQVALTAFIPMIMGTGGNAGSQASVTVIRGLSLGELGYSDVFRILFKELRVSLLCGGAVAIATFLKIILIDNLLLGSGISLTVALVVALTMAFTIFIAKLIGCSLPLLAGKLGLDPAVMASPFITTIVDALSLLVYFGVASAVLNI